MIKRLLAAALAAGAALGLAGSTVVALSFALYALLKPYITPAGASAGVALVCVIVAGISFLVMTRRAKGGAVRHEVKKGRHEAATGGFGVDRLLDLARERPIAAAAAAVAAGLVALRNPALVGTVTRLFLDPKRPPRR